MLVTPSRYVNKVTAPPTVASVYTGGQEEHTSEL